MTEAALARCEVLFDLGLWALKTLGPLAFEAYNRGLYQLPAVQERVFDMPLSGIDDMAALVGPVWHRLADWFTRGPPQAPPPNLAAEAGAEDGQDDLRVRRFFAAVAPHWDIADRVRAASGGNRWPPVPVISMQGQQGHVGPGPVFNGLAAATDTALDGGVFALLADVWGQLLPEGPALQWQRAAVHPGPSSSGQTIPRKHPDTVVPAATFSVLGDAAMEYHGHAVCVCVCLTRYRRIL